MALLSTYNSANKVEIEPSNSFEKDHGTYVTGYGQMYQKTETVTVYKFKYVGMTKTAAQDCGAAQKALYGDIGGKVTLRPAGGSAWDVEVNQYYSVYTDTLIE